VRFTGRNAAMARNVSGNPQSQCTACYSKRRKEIDGMLSEGIAPQIIAGRMGLSKSAVQRHKKNHWNQQAAPIISGRLHTSIGAAVRTIKQAQKMFRMAEAKNKFTAMAQAVRLESTARKELARLEQERDIAAAPESAHAILPLSNTGKEPRSGNEYLVKVTYENPFHLPHQRRAWLRSELGSDRHDLLFPEWLKHQPDEVQEIAAVIRMAAMASLAETAEDFLEIVSRGDDDAFLRKAARRYGADRSSDDGQSFADGSGESGAAAEGGDDGGSSIQECAATGVEEL